MSAQKTPKLPETPFNGVVVSAIKVEHGGYTYVHLAIAEEHDREQPLVVFCTFHLGTTVDPRGHLSEGDKVKVTGVSGPSGVIQAESMTFDVGQFANRLRKAAADKE